MKPNCHTRILKFIVIAILVFTGPGTYLYCKELLDIGKTYILNSEYQNLSRLTQQYEGSARSRETFDSLLIYAAIWGDVDSMEILLNNGANANYVNGDGSSVLVLCAYDYQKAKLLVNNGADVNLASRRGNTPLSVAASHPTGFKSLKFLIDSGARIDSLNKAGKSPLGMALFSGSKDSVKELVIKGANVNGSFGWGGSNSLLTIAVERQSMEVVKFLLDHGADLSLTHQFSGTPLNMAMLSEKKELAKFLLKSGANPNVRSPIGNVPPLLFSTHFELEDTSIAQALLDKNVEANAKNQYGESALTWAKQRDHQNMTSLLKKYGARSNQDSVKLKNIPKRNISLNDNNINTILSDSVSKSLSLLQKSSDVFLKNRGSCVSCHHQYIPAIALGWARNKGFTIDSKSLNSLIEHQAKEWSTRRVAALELENPFFFNARIFGWGLYGFSALNQPSTPVIDSVVNYLIQTQRLEGNWNSGMLRPPLGGNDIMATALVLMAIKEYPLKQANRKTQNIIERSRAWLSTAKVETHQDNVFRLLGLHWAGEDIGKLQPGIDEIINSQNSDGGWSQLPGLNSDAWATGESLIALGLIDRDYVHSNTYIKGLEFLINTQFDDGSWFVPRRTWPMQQHFDSQFPHGKDQWISASATSFAAMSMLLAIDQASMSISPVTSIPHPKLVKYINSDILDDQEIDFRTTIEPILDDACLDCHSGEDAESNLSLETIALIKRGGNSGVPAFIPGKPEESPVFLFSAGIIEDMEMPPLHERKRYQALNEKQLTKIWHWIKNYKNNE